MAFDILTAAVSIYAALCLRHEDLLSPRELAPFMPLALAPFLVRPLVNMRFGLYRRVWRFASVTELVQILAASATGSVVALALALLVLWPISGVATFIGPTFWVVEFIVNVGLVGGVRFLIRAVAEWQTQRSADLAGTGRVPTLLYGAGKTGMIIARSGIHEPKAGVRPVGFLDDDPSRAGKSVGGIPVFGGLSSLRRAVETTNARMLLITMPTATGQTLRNIMEAGLAAGLEVRTVPPIHELMDGSIDAFRARRVKVDDLLGRPLATEHAPAVEDLIRGKTVMITGAGGSIGSELARQVHSLGPKRLVLIDRAESPLYTIQRELEVRHLHGRGTGVIEPCLANVVSRDLMRRLVAAKRPGHHLPRRRLQARADDGGAPVGGRPGQRRGNPVDARCGGRRRRAEFSCSSPPTRRSSHRASWARRSASQRPWSATPPGGAGMRSHRSASATCWVRPAASSRSS